MISNVELSYNEYPEQLSGGIIKISDTKEIKLSITDEKDGLNLEIIDNLFGTKNITKLNLNLETSKDLYSIFYLLINQITNNK